MRRILVVEDEDLLREGYNTILSSEPYIIDTASNGKEALAKFTSHKYDLVLLDIMMPVMDGVTFLEKISALPERGNAKVILLTNLSDGQEIDAAMQSGASGHLLKANLSPRQLLAKVRYEVEAD